MIMNSFPDCAISSCPFRAVVGGSEDLGIDDTKKEDRDCVDDGDTDQADRNSDHIRAVIITVVKVLGYIAIKCL